MEEHNVERKAFSTTDLGVCFRQADGYKNDLPFSSVISAPFCIYGAGIVAVGVYTAIKTLYQKTPLFFLVSDAAEGKVDENPSEIDGIPVKRLCAWRHELPEMRTGKSRKNTQNRLDRDVMDASGVHPIHYLVAAPKAHHASITASLRSLEIEDSEIQLITGELENRLMEAYYSGWADCNTVSGLIEGLGQIRSFGLTENGQGADRQRTNKADAAHIQVFQAQCHVDRALQNPIQPPSYVYPIQVGADLTDRRVSEICDNTGKNISCKNRNYCELTATYYAWKNCRAEYKGLCHYRRIFEINDEQMRILLEKKEDWDVILPYPSIHFPNISTQHLRYIKEEDWKAMLQALAEKAPDYLDVYQKLSEMGEQYFFNYNMLIAKAEVFDDYCRFLFSVLERAEELTTPRGWERADRFAGYMGENLTTIYFLRNKDKLKIVYAGKKWLI